MVHLIRWACFFITLLLSLVLIVPFLYELQGSLWLHSIKVIGQCAYFMSFGWADCAGSSSLRRLGDQMPVAPTITSQLITEFGDRENSGGGSYIIYKRTQFGPRTQKKQSVSFWQCPCGFGFFFFWCLIKNGPHKTDVWCGDWSALQRGAGRPSRVHGHIRDTYADTYTNRRRKPHRFGCAQWKGCIHISTGTFLVRHTCTNTTPPKTHTHTHTLTSYPAPHSKRVSPQVVEKRVREAWSQDGPGWLGSSRRLPPCVKMIMTTPEAPRPQRTCVEDLWRAAGVAGRQRFGSSGWRALSDTSGKLIV